MASSFPNTERGTMRPVMFGLALSAAMGAGSAWSAPSQSDMSSVLRAYFNEVNALYRALSGLFR